MLIQEKMNTKVRKHILIPIATVAFCMLSACGNFTREHGNPTLNCEAPVYDDVTQTFSLIVLSDSTSGAALTFALIKGDSVIMENNDGKFCGIPAFEEGYRVRMEAKWKDTTIVRTTHVANFVVPCDSVDKMSADELEQLINSCDRSIRRASNKHLIQGVKLIVTDCRMVTPQMLPDVITFIENEVWQSVEVISLEYDDNNLITSITLRPIGEQAEI